MDRLVDLVRRAAATPRYRRPTKPTRGSKERRLTAQRRQGTTKKGRDAVSDID